LLEIYEGGADLTGLRIRSYRGTDTDPLNQLFGVGDENTVVVFAEEVV